MARPSFSLTEYRELAEKRDLELLGAQIPNTVRDKTLWRCKRCGETQHKSFHYLKYQKHGCKCQNGKSLPIDSYIALGQRLGITLLTPYVPRNIFQKVLWEDRHGEKFEACYRDMAYERLPAALREHVNL